jgi:tetratricopeptide (TPR) repeat protein
VALANKEALRAMDTYRNTDARQKLLYASFLNRIGELDQALAYSIEARRLSPQKQQIMFEQVGIYGNRGELDRALAAAKEAFLLDESYPEARRVYALVLIFAGREKEAEALLRETKEFIIDRRFVQAYLERNRAAAGLAFVKSLEEEYGTVADLYYIQASFFIALGNKNEAVRALEKALELNPNQKEETEALIAEVKSS